MVLIPEFRITYFLIGAILFLTMKIFEKFKWFGAKELPQKDSLLIIYLMVGDAFIWVVADQIIYFISLPASCVGIIFNQLLSTILLSISAIIFCSNAFINPSKNFLISVIIGGASAIILTFVFIQTLPGIIFEGYGSVIWGFLAHFIGLIIGIIVYIILYFINKNGLKELWTAKKYWNIVNHYGLLIPLLILTIVESVLGLHFLSLLTIFFY
ncbi:MAG: hypothetical protein ACTSWR_04030 [Candidatus Helarchaeota archaeon]